MDLRYLFLLLILAMPCTNCLAQQNRADAVIDACIEANGGYAYLDSLLQFQYSLSRVISNYGLLGGTSFGWRATPKLTQYENYEQRDGASRLIKTDLENGAETTMGLNKDYAWHMEADELNFINTGLHFRSLWELYDDDQCLYEPLNYHSSCRQNPLTWARTDTEAGRHYDVLLSSGVFELELWFDQETHLLYKYAATSGTSQHFYEDYQQHGKLWVAHTINSYRNGQLANQTIYDSISFPAHLPDSRFYPPAPLPLPEPDNPEEYGK